MSDIIKPNEYQGLLKYPLLLWLSAILFYFFQFSLRVAPSVIANDLMEFLSIDSLQLGFLVSCYYYGYAFMQAPGGILLDRFGSRLPMVLATFLCGVGAFVFSIGHSVAALSFARFIMGLGSSVVFISCVKIASELLSQRRVSFFVSLTLLMGTLGAVASGKPLALLVDAWGWRSIHMGFSLVCFVLCLWIAVTFPSVKALHGFLIDQKRINKDHSLAQGSMEESPPESFAKVIEKKQTWFNGLYNLTLYIPIVGIADLWGVPYLMKAYDFDRATASSLNAMVYFGMGTGGLLWSFLAQHAKSYKRPMATGTVLTFFLLWIYIFCHDLPPFLLGVISFLIGFCATSQFLTYANITALHPFHRVGVALGVQTMLCTCSGILIQPLLGFILRATWDGQCTSTGPIYSVESFQRALLVLPLCCAVSMGFLFLIKDCYPKLNPTKKCSA